MRIAATGSPGRIRAIAISIVALLAGTIAAAGQAQAATARERGKALYESNCAVCHGTDGRADTPVGRLLKPGPRNFSDPVEMARVSSDRMYRSIKDGRPGTGMAAWKDALSEIQIGDLIDYVRDFSTSAKASAPSGEALSIEVGRRIFERECASCHGKDGNADTEVAKVLDPPPRKFADPVAMARLDDGRIYLAIYRGRPGTAMGGRGELLSSLEIIDVMRYLRTLVRPLPPGTGPEQLDFQVGEVVYKKHCAACHGDAGDARTEIAQHLLPHPRDFTRQSEMAKLSDEQLSQSILHGVSGTGMAPWEGVLNREDVRRVLAYIRRNFARG
jgi:mono/diheme cytochrome c family protein